MQKEGAIVSAIKDKTFYYFIIIFIAVAIPGLVICSLLDLSLVSSPTKGRSAPASSTLIKDTTRDEKEQEENACSKGLGINNILS